MTTGIWVLGDQLWAGQSALASCQSAQRETPVILIESRDYARQHRYHRQKLVLIWSAMRHFAAALRADGWSVTYTIADDFGTPLHQWIQANKITEVRVMYPNNHPFRQIINNLQLGCPLHFVPNNHFLWRTEDFQQWATSRKRLLLEDFYRTGRREFKILMHQDQPIGGQWNFDSQNRQPPKGQLNPPSALWFEPDAITQAVIQEVQALDFPGYGALEPFRWGVTRASALAVLDHFVAHGLPSFGPLQDAMVTQEETMWHSLVSPYLNLGLLQPREVITAVETAYLNHNLALNSVEGFIRQVLGWREYMNGLYHYLKDDYGQSNWFHHTEPLPAFYWDSTQTNLNCLRQILSQVEKTGYAHHIQRLMVLSNFALIVGVSPQEIEGWFHAAFVDAYDWVMQTNVIGMGQFADGGILASKPYAASANYIKKMSDYCSHCYYNANDRTGEQACPFNFFYWDFLDRHQEKLKSIGRMNVLLGNLNRMDADDLDKMRVLAEAWRQQHRQQG
ncbi:cryptochrome/photolyase family protein [Leptolyngbya sp. 'hensonii']|uniref:cryptochrome/photolyase family protein n=1 Tax=Leptolyngbya sp. 'hensonii' TaxID=1922337 RepID=UPI000950018E|nr:cryptochrome/photolyase family protein [Leptolyngbya sp. 'hensonii']OLP18869.1 cryptochrome/photolyase family protein [Leptolyngbya sp. 'hensonii']